MSKYIPLFCADIHTYQSVKHGDLAKSRLLKEVPVVLERNIHLRGDIVSKPCEL